MKVNILWKNPVARLLIPAVVALPGGCMAEDWPQWRGMNRDSAWHEEGLARKFALQGPPLRWCVPVGTGFSSPCIAGDRVIVTDSIVSSLQCRERVQCFSSRTGRVYWTVSYPVAYPDYGADPQHPFGPIATPVTADGKVYCRGRMSDVLCINALTGTIDWHFQPSLQYLTAEDLRGANSSPVIEGSRLIFSLARSSRSSVIALDIGNGKPVWESFAEIPSDSSPFVITASGRRQVVVWAYQSAAGIDPETGRILWLEEINSGPSYPVASPVLVREDQVLLGGLMLELTGQNPGVSIKWPPVEERKFSRLHGSDTSTAAVWKDMVLTPTAQGKLQALEATTGQTKWETRGLTTERPGASLHIVTVPKMGIIYVWTDRGDLILGSPEPEGFRELDRCHLLDPTADYGGRKVAWTPASYAEGSIFVRNDKELKCFSLLAGPAYPQ